MTERFAWVADVEMFSLVLAKEARPEDLAAELTAGEAERLPSAESWPQSVGAIKFVTGEEDGWAYALAFDSGLLTSRALDAIARRWDVVSVWFDINANSEFRSYRAGALVRRCSVIGYGFEPSDGDPLTEEQGLFVDSELFDERTDGLELVARVTAVEPQESWWGTSSLAWAAGARS